VAFLQIAVAKSNLARIAGIWVGRGSIHLELMIVEVLLDVELNEADERRPFSDRL